MTSLIDPDRKPPSQPLLPFDPAALDRCGIRMNRAEFSRFLGVSKQAVSDWTRAGKLTLGADGLLDPRQAVAQLLRTTDPARLRAKVLAPLTRDIGALQKRVADLSAQLANAEEDGEFHEGAAKDLIAEFDALHDQLREEWRDLRLLPASQALAALEAWVANMHNGGLDPDLQIMDCVPLAEFDGAGTESMPAVVVGEGNGI